MHTLAQPTLSKYRRLLRLQRLRLAALAAGLAGGLLLASAVQASSPIWVWVDNNGRHAASDLPPPATVPEQRILRRPQAFLATAAPDAGAAAAAAQGALPQNAAPTRPAPPAPPAAGAAGASRLTNEQLRQQVEQRNVQIRADNCQRARASLEALQTGANQPLYQLNEQGQRVTMDEAMRRAESVRLRQIVRDNCEPAAAATAQAAPAAAPSRP